MVFSIPGVQSKVVPTEQLELVEVDLLGNVMENSDQGSWSHILRELLRLFLIDDVPRDYLDGFPGELNRRMIMSLGWHRDSPGCYVNSEISSPRKHVLPFAFNNYSQ